MKKNNVYITSAVRTAVASLGKSLKNVPADDLGACVIKNVLSKSGVKKNEVDEIVLGQVLTGGAGQNPARQAAIKSGIPKEVPAYIVNQVCGSGIRSLCPVTWPSHTKNFFELKAFFTSLATGQSSISFLSSI